MLKPFKQTNNNPLHTQQQKENKHNHLRLCARERAGSYSIQMSHHKQAQQKAALLGSGRMQGTPSLRMSQPRRAGEHRSVRAAAEGSGKRTPALLSEITS